MAVSSWYGGAAMHVVETGCPILRGAVGRLDSFGSRRTAPAPLTNHFDARSLLQSSAINSRKTHRDSRYSATCKSFKL